MIEGVTADSRKVKPGWLFAALPGAKADGRDFVARRARGRRRRGARRATPIEGLAAPVVQVGDPRRAYALAAAAFWGAQPETCVAVTGTNGKTSVATFCRQIFAAARPHARPAWARWACSAGDEQITPPGPDHARRRRRRRACWPTSPAAASPTWRWRPPRTASTSAASTA